MNSFKRHIYKNNKVNKKVTLLTLDPTSATLSSSLPNDVVVQVISNSSWSVGQIPDWFSITGGSGSGDGLFVIDTQNNNSSTTRSHLLSVTAGEIGETVTRTFLITQQAFVPTLTLDPTSKDLLGVNPGNFVVDVISNTSWSVITTPPDWFSIIGGSGSGDGGFSIASIGDNPDGPRSFELVVSTQGLVPISKSVTINQAVAPEEVEESTLSLVETDRGEDQSDDGLDRSEYINYEVEITPSISSNASLSVTFDMFLDIYSNAYQSSSLFASIKVIKNGTTIFNPSITRSDMSSDEFNTLIEDAVFNINSSDTLAIELVTQAGIAGQNANDLASAFAKITIKSAEFIGSQRQIINLPISEFSRTDSLLADVG